MEQCDACRGASDDVGRRAFQIRTEVRRLQRAVSAPELCPQPVIAAVHGACIGGGIDLITACDIRVCSDDAFFTVKVCAGHILLRPPHGTSILTRVLCARRSILASQQTSALCNASRRSSATRVPCVSWHSQLESFMQTRHCGWGWSAAPIMVAGTAYWPLR